MDASDRGFSTSEESYFDDQKLSQSFDIFEERNADKKVSSSSSSSGSGSAVLSLSSSASSFHTEESDAESGGAKEEETGERRDGVGDTAKESDENNVTFFSKLSLEKKGVLGHTPRVLQILVRIDKITNERILVQNKYEISVSVDGAAKRIRTHSLTTEAIRKNFMFYFEYWHDVLSINKYLKLRVVRVKKHSKARTTIFKHKVPLHEILTRRVFSSTQRFAVRHTQQEIEDASEDRMPKGRRSPRKSFIRRDPKPVFDSSINLKVRSGKTRHIRRASSLEDIPGSGDQAGGDNESPDLPNSNKWTLQFSIRNFPMTGFHVLSEKAGQLPPKESLSVSHERINYEGDLFDLDGMVESMGDDASTKATLANTKDDIEIVDSDSNSDDSSSGSQSAPAAGSDPKTDSESSIASPVSGGISEFIQDKDDSEKSNTGIGSSSLSGTARSKDAADLSYGSMFDLVLDELVEKMSKEAPPAAPRRFCFIESGFDTHGIMRRILVDGLNFTVKDVDTSKAFSSFKIRKNEEHSTDEYFPVAICGEDGFISRILYSYVHTLSKLARQQIIRPVFCIIPMGQRTDVALHIATQSVRYKEMFIHSNFQKMISEKWVGSDVRAGLEELVGNIKNYLSSDGIGSKKGGRAPKIISELSINEAYITSKTGQASVPFLKLVQIGSNKDDDDDSESVKSSKKVVIEYMEPVEKSEGRKGSKGISEHKKDGEPFVKLKAKKFSISLNLLMVTPLQSVSSVMGFHKEIPPGTFGMMIQGENKSKVRKKRKKEKKLINTSRVIIKPANKEETINVVVDSRLWRDVQIISLVQGISGKIKTFPVVTFS